MKQKSLKKTALACAVTLSLLVFSNASYAKYELQISPMITFIVYEPADGRYDPSNPNYEATSDLDPSYIPLIRQGLTYWENMIKPYAKNDDPIRIDLFPKIDADNNAGAYSSKGETQEYSYLTELSAYIFYNYVETAPDAQDQDVVAFMTVDKGLGYPSSDWYNGVMSNLPNCGIKSDLSSTIVHEFAHALGIINGDVSDDYIFQSNDLYTQGLRDLNGNTAHIGQQIVDKEHYVEGSGDFVLDNLSSRYTGLYFTGKNVDEVLNGAYIAWPSDSSVELSPVPGLPINGFEEDSSDFSHIELQNAQMSHQNYRNWNILMEAELALLQDTGVLFDRKNMYGYSIYNSGTEDNRRSFVNDNPYYARENSQWVTGQYNNTSYGIGLHVYGSYNDVYQRADILSSGLYGIGIRSDGMANNITVLKGTKVSADGYGGIGLLVSYGKDHNVTVDGTVSALGEKGDAIRFDFGDNNLGNLTEYRGSYIRTIVNNDILYLLEIMPETNGRLVNNFNLSGSIQGTNNAIYISKNALVNNINILRGASIQGNITSEWDPLHDLIQYDEDKSDLITSINFGTTANDEDVDPNFSIRYDGNINAANGAKLNFEAGYTSLNGTINVLNSEVQSGAQLGGNATYNLTSKTIGSEQTGYFTNGGLLTPGNSIGTISINGNYVQSSTGELGIEFDSNSNDKLVVNGDANVNGKISFTALSDYYNGLSNYSFKLSDALVVSGNAIIDSSVIENIATPTLKSPTLSVLMDKTGSIYNDAAYSIKVYRAPNAYSKYASSSNSSKLGVGLYKGSFFANGLMQSLYQDIDFSDETGIEVGPVLDSLSPTQYANAVQGVFDSDNYLNTMLFTDIKQASKDGVGIQGYIKPYLMNGNRGDGFTGYRSNNNYGLILGADDIDTDITKGMYLVANNRYQRSNNSSSIRDNSLTLGVKTLVDLNAANTFKLFASGNLGINDMKVQKSFGFKNTLSSSKSHFTAFNSSFDLGLSYDVVLGSITLSPKADVQYSMFYQPKVSEKGEASSLNIDSSLFNSLRVGIGIDLLTDKYALTKSSTYQTAFGIAYHKELLSRAGSFKASFRNAPNSEFDHEVDFLGKDSLDIKGRFSIYATNDKCFSINAGTQLYRGNGHNFYGRLDYSFKF